MISKKIALSYCKIVSLSAIASELLDKWQGNRRSSISKEDVNVVRWEQLKHVLQSGKQKVDVYCLYFMVKCDFTFFYSLLIYN